MYLLLEYLGDEEALKAQVLPVWKLHYDEEYLEGSILPRIKTNTSLLSQLVAQIKKIAVCESPVKPSEKGKGVHGEGNTSGKTTAPRSATSTIESPHQQRRRQSAPVPAEVPLQMNELRNIIRKRFASTFVPSVPAVLSNRKNSMVPAVPTLPTQSDTFASEDQHSPSSSHETSNQSTNCAAVPPMNARETVKFASLTESNEDCSEDSQSIEPQSTPPDDANEDTETQKDLPIEVLESSNSCEDLTCQRVARKGETL